MVDQPKVAKMYLFLYFFLAVIVVQTTIIAAPAEPSKFDLVKLREHVNKGNIYLSRLNFQQALDEYEECLRIDPSNQTARDNIVLCHNNWGICYFKQMKYAPAKAEWEKALKLNPFDRNAKTNMTILKNVMAKSGTGLDTMTGADTQKNKSHSGAVLLTPGYKQSQSSSLDQTTSTSNADQSNTSSIKILNTNPVGTTSTINPIPKSDADNPPKDESAGSSLVKGSTKAETITQPLNSNVPEIYSPDMQGITSSSQAIPATSIPGTIEGRLAQLELKLYGKKRENIPILIRLDQLELDTSGKTKIGPINDRVEALRRSYGI